MWKQTNGYAGGDYEMPDISQTWVQSSDGSFYRCLSFVSKTGQMLSIQSMLDKLEKRISEGKDLQFSIGLAQPGAAAATLGVAQLNSLSDMSVCGKKVKEGAKALSQCKDDISACIGYAKSQIEYFNDYLSKALDVDGKRSTDTVLILDAEPDVVLPESTQRLEFFDFSR